MNTSGLIDGSSLESSQDEIAKIRRVIKETEPKIGRVFIHSKDLDAN